MERISPTALDVVSMSFLCRSAGTLSPDYTTPPCQPQMASDDRRRPPDERSHCNSCGHPPSCHCLILHESEQSRPLPCVLRGNYDCWSVQQRGNTVIPPATRLCQSTSTPSATFLFALRAHLPPLVPSPPAPSTSFSSAMSQLGLMTVSHNFPAVCDSSTHDSAVPVNNNFYN